MKLYYNPRSRAVVSKWMLDECGAGYEIVTIDFEKGEHKSPEFLKINPAGKLPALVDGESKIFESAAICLYLGDKFAEAKLAPKINAPERGRYLSLMVYSTSQLEPALGDTMLGAQTSSQRGWTDFETARNLIEGELGDGRLPVR
jgi:glutathione S-transferase